MNLSKAVEHLATSAEIVGECRLSSYGPSFRLAAELSQHGHWSPVIEYLRACSVFWDDERLDKWISELDARRMPSFPDR